MSVQLKQLFDQRAKVDKDQKDILASYTDGKIPADVRAKYEALDTEFGELTASIKILEEQRKRNEAAALRADASMDQKEDGREPNKEKASYRSAFNAWAGNPKEDARLVAAMQEARGTSTQITSTNSLGGFLVPEEWTAEIIAAMQYTGGIMEAVDVYYSQHGGDMPIPGYDDTSVKSVIIGQGTGETVSDVTITNKTLNAYTYTSNLIKMSWEQIQDSNFEAEITSIIGGRHARGIRYDATLGTGSSQPEGLTVGASSGVTSVAAIGVDDLLDLVHSVNRAYRSSLKAGFMLSDATFKALRKLKDTDGLPIFQAARSYLGGEVDTILGYRVFINDDMPAATAASSNKAVLFGDFGKYRLRIAKNPELVVLRERYADERSNGYLGYLRMDGKLLDTAAVKYLQMTTA